MIRILCDCCGEKVERSEAYQIALIPKAYAANAEREVSRNELCPACAAAIMERMREGAGGDVRLCDKDGGALGASRSTSAEDNKLRISHEGRCITVARMRAGLSQKAAAALIYYSDHVVGEWERGKGRPKWDELYKILPELSEIRAKGCGAYCDKATECEDGKYCIYASKTAVRQAKKHEER